jgi:hypothetical protein
LCNPDFGKLIQEEIGTLFVSFMRIDDTPVTFPDLSLKDVA